MDILQWQSPTLQPQCSEGRKGNVSGILSWSISFCPSVLVTSREDTKSKKASASLQTPGHALSLC